ncbi:MAG: twin-arginine translocase subunit TatC [Chitinophagales bacterium]
MPPLDQHFEDDKPRREKEMSFIEHLEELRWHIFRSITAIFIIALAVFILKGIVFDFLIFGPTRPDFPTYKILCSISEKMGIGKAFCFETFNFNIINIEVAGQFLVHLKVSFILGLIVAFPYIFWEFWRFISPALYENEARTTKGVVFFTSLLFLIGIFFGYYVLTPFSINFFSNYGVSDLVANQWKLTNYVSTVTMIVLASGILFELPMIVYFLSKVGLLTPSIMRTHRKHALIINLIISAIITPADVGTQILVSIPVVFLYELSIGISGRVYKNRMKKLAQEH